MANLDRGVIRRPSRYTVDETVSRIEAILREKSIHLFMVIDHSGDAEKAGLKMPATKLLIFGNAKAGTPLMLSASTVALDLPLKLLVSEEDGRVWISYNDPSYLQQRHGFSPELTSNIAGLESLSSQAGE